MNYNIELKDGCATIEFGQSDISGKYRQSSNGEYYILCDTLYSPSNCRDYLFVFTKQDVVYKKAIPGEERVNWFMVSDEGESFIVTDAYILILSLDGKQVMKKTLPLFTVCYFVGNTLYVVGENDSGITFLLLLDVVSKSVSKKVVPNIDSEKQSSSYAELLFTGEKFVFVYENEVDAIAFDLHGNKVLPSIDEVETANANRRERIKNSKIERAKSQYEYWTKRLEREKQNNNPKEIERSELEIKKYKERLLGYGIIF